MVYLGNTVHGGGRRRGRKANVQGKGRVVILETGTIIEDILVSFVAD